MEHQLTHKSGSHAAWLTAMLVSIYVVVLAMLFLKKPEKGISDRTSTQTSYQQQSGQQMTSTPLPQTITQSR